MLSKHLIMLSKRYKRKKPRSGRGFLRLLLRVILRQLPA